MKNLKVFLLSITALLSITILNAQVEQPVKWNSSVEDLGNGEFQVTFSASIDTLWYMYDLGPYEGGPNATLFMFADNDKIQWIGDVSAVTKAVVKFDEIFGMDIGYLSGKSDFSRKGRLLSGTKGTQAIVMVEWQACDDMSCLPPEEHEFKITIGDQITTSDSNIVAQNQDDQSGRSMWATIIEAILWGFAALLTPCVFPMVPMTVSFFMKNSESKTKGRFFASLYGISIITLYTLPIAIIILVTYIFGGDAVTADIFNWLATHWLPNVIFFLIFMLFAASFFGAFEIVMPSWIINKSDSKSDKGGIIGTFFMAVTLVLVSFSCTGPIVGSILVKSTQGDIWEPILTMFVFSAAFALPFTLFAFFPSMLKSLPRSGGWLNSVKVVLGFIELALGLKFLSVADQTYHWGILDREVYLALWIVIFFLLGLYLLGKLRFAHDSETTYIKVKSLFLAIVTFAFVVYLIPGMFGAPLKALSGYLPPVHSLDFNLTNNNSMTIKGESEMKTGKIKYSDFLHLPHTIEGFFDYNEGMKYAKKVGKPVFLDFTGHGCVNCREMEANVWSDPAVLSILKNDYVVIALYVDDKKSLPESEWIINSKGKTLKTLGKINAEFQIEKFGTNAQPYYVLLNNDEVELVPPRGYNLNAEAFVKFLENGLEAYKK